MTIPVSLTERTELSKSDISGPEIENIEQTDTEFQNSSNMVETC